MKTPTPNIDILRANTLSILPMDKLLPSKKTNKKRTGPVKAKEANSALEVAVSKASAKSTNGGNFSRTAENDAFKNFEEAVGGRVELREILKHCPPTAPAYKALKRLFEDVDFNAIQDTTLALLCGKHKINLAQLMIAFREATVVQMNVEAVRRLSKHLSPVVENVADDSKNRFEQCSVCEGLARVPRIGEDGEFAFDEDENPITQLCYNCRGTGKVYTKHDPQSRKLFFQLAGLLKPEGKDKDLPAINIANISGSFVPGDGSYEYLIKAIDKVAIPARIQSEEAIEVPYALYETETEKSEVNLNSTNPA